MVCAWREYLHAQHWTEWRTFLTRVEESSKTVPLHTVSAWLTVFLRLHKREQNAQSRYAMGPLTARCRLLRQWERLRSCGMWRRVLCTHVTTCQNNQLSRTSEYNCSNGGNRLIRNVGIHQTILRHIPEDQNFSYLQFSICATFMVPYE